MFLVELLTLKLPYDGLLVLDVKQAILSQTLPNMTPSELYSKDETTVETLKIIQGLVDCCLQFDALKRPDAVSLLQKLESNKM